MDAQLQRRMTALDAMFVYLEQPHQPMNVGAVCVFEGPLPYAALLKHMRGWLHLVPRYRQRVVMTPLNVGHPTWEDDPDFDLKRHVFRHRLDAPGGEAQLKDLAGQIFTGLLDREKPLWEVHLVEGLAGNRSALIFKVHHCMADGVSGLGLTAVLFDIAPAVRGSKAKRHRPAPPTPAGMRLYDALWDNVTDKLAHWTRLQRSLVTLASGLSPDEFEASLTKFTSTMSSFLLPIRKLPFNRPLSEERRISWRGFSMAEARGIRALCGGTINDVALTVISGAVRRLLERHPGKRGKAMAETVRVLVPVNVREEHERGELGNRISFLLVDTPVNIADPMERLRAIRALTKEMKDKRFASAVSVMFEALQGIPVIGQALGLNAIGMPLVQALLRHVTAMPPANMIATNVPGPQIPLYALGQRLEALYPTLPVCLEMGANFAITSYDQKLFITVTGDGVGGGDVELLAQYVEESFVELREACAVTPAPYVEIRKQPPAPPVAQATMPGDASDTVPSAEEAGAGATNGHARRARRRSASHDRV